MILSACLGLFVFLTLNGNCAASGKPAHEIVWHIKQGDEVRAWDPNVDTANWGELKFGEQFSGQGVAWLRAELCVPEFIGGEPVTGKPVGLRWFCGCGEIYLNGKLYCRYDNDHRAMILVSRRASPGEKHTAAVKIFMSTDPNKEETLSIEECEWQLVDPRRASETLELRIDCSKSTEELWQPFSGLSQGAGMTDYEPGTAATFRDIGIKWVRMDNILTHVLKKDDDGNLWYDWSDLDRRTDFIRSFGAEPIYSFSYMPEVLDATPCPHRHSRPNDWDAWEELCYQTVKHCVERATPVKYWEVWNEANAGWITVLPGEDLFETYIQMYDRCARAVQRADPDAWIGGPSNAAGPWDDGDKIGLPGVRGETFMRGLIEHCAETGTPLDFISWHEYFHPWWIMRKEVERTREILSEYPSVERQVKELMVTEWNFAWWHDLAQDHELGAAYCSTGAIRAWSAMKVDKPCFFFAKDGSPPFRGNWGMITKDNIPKPVGNACKLFNMLCSHKLEIGGLDADVCGKENDVDTDICGLASLDPHTGRVAVLIVNFPSSRGIPRRLRLVFENLPEALRNGTYRRWLVDKEHCNRFHDESQGKLKSLEERQVKADRKWSLELTLEWNAVSLIELFPHEN